MIFGWDIETHLLNPYRADARLLTAAVWTPDLAWGSPIEWDYRPELVRVSQPIEDLLTDPTATVVGHNIVAFDIPYWERRTGVRVQAQLFDTQVARALLDETGEGNSLEDLAQIYLGMSKADDGLNKKRLKWADPDKVLRYNVVDCEIAYKLYEPLLAEIKANGQEGLFQFLMEVGRELADMMLAGAKIDTSFVDTMGTQLEEEANYLEWQLNEALDEDTREEILMAAAVKSWEEGTKEISYIGGSEINFSSPDQVAQLLFGSPGFNLPSKKETDSGAPSTSAKVLKLMIPTVARKHPAVGDWLDAFLAMKERQKLVGTYLKPFVDKHMGEDGRVHTSYKLGKSLEFGGAATGRLASSGPNLQNIPRDARVKGAFIPEPGWRMFEADYSQMELRVGAWYAEEPSMMQAFVRGEDIHTSYLAEGHGIPYEEMKRLVSTEDPWPERRNLIKPVQFGVFYGGGPYMLIEQAHAAGIKLTFPEARQTIDDWFARRPKIKQWITATQDVIIANKEIRTPTGRVRHLPAASRHTKKGWQALRQGVNFMVQSLASDHMLAALRRMGRLIREAEEGHWLRSVRLCLTVHDSVVGEYDPDRVDATVLEEWIRQQMTEGVEKDMRELFGVEGIPLAVDVDTGLNRWKELK